MNRRAHSRARRFRGPKGRIFLVVFSVTLGGLSASDNDLDDYSYIMGRRHALDFYLNSLPIDQAAFDQGFREALNRKKSSRTIGSLRSVIEKTDSTIPTYRSANASDHLRMGRELIEENRKNSSMTESDSGLQFTELVAGEGDHPKLGEKVRIRLEATLPNGIEVFPFQTQSTELDFLLSDRDGIPGLTEALLQARPGGTYQAVIPPQLGFGEEGRPSVPSNATLILKFTLLDIIDESDINY